MFKSQQSGNSQQLIHSQLLGNSRQPINSPPSGNSKQSIRNQHKGNSQQSINTGSQLPVSSNSQTIDHDSMNKQYLTMDQNSTI